MLKIDYKIQTKIMVSDTVHFYKSYKSLLKYFFYNIPYHEIEAAIINI